MCQFSVNKNEKYTLFFLPVDLPMGGLSKELLKNLQQQSQAAQLEMFRRLQAMLPKANSQWPQAGAGHK